MFRARCYIPTDDEIRSQKDFCFLGYRTGNVLKTLCRIIKFPVGYGGGGISYKVLFAADYFMRVKHLSVRTFWQPTLSTALHSRRDFLEQSNTLPLLLEQEFIVRGLKLRLYLNAKMVNYWIKITLHWFSKLLSVSRIL